MNVTAYALTVTYQRNTGTQPLWQFHDTAYELWGLLRRSTDFVMFPELTVQGKIHYHGIVRITDKYKWFKWTLPKLKSLGFIKIKSNVDSGWDEYIKKDQVIMSKLGLSCIDNRTFTTKKTDPIEQKMHEVLKNIEFERKLYYYVNDKLSLDNC